MNFKQFPPFSPPQSNIIFKYIVYIAKKKKKISLAQCTTQLLEKGLLIEKCNKTLIQHCILIWEECQTWDTLPCQVKVLIFARKK